MNPNYKHQDFVGLSSHSLNSFENIPEKDYYKTWPTVIGNQKFLSDERIQLY